VLPVAPGGWSGGHGAERLGCPGRGRLGGVLAKTPGAVVHYRGDLGQVGTSVGIGQLANRLVGILHSCLKTRTLYDEQAA
jgi:hypothetical protein